MTSSAADRHQAAEIARLKRTLAKPDLLTFEREHAEASLQRLLRGPECRWCLCPESTHQGAVCRVLDRFRRKHGKGLNPTETQAADIRAAIAADDAAKAAAERRKDGKVRQGGFGF